MKFETFISLLIFYFVGSLTFCFDHLYNLDLFLRNLFFYFEMGFQIFKFLQLIESPELTKLKMEEAKTYMGNSYPNLIMVLLKVHIRKLEEN